MAPRDVYVKRDSPLRLGNLLMFGIVGFLAGWLTARAKPTVAFRRSSLSLTLESGCTRSLSMPLYSRYFTGQMEQACCSLLSVEASFLHLSGCTMTQSTMLRSTGPAFSFTEVPSGRVDRDNRIRNQQAALGRLAHGEGEAVSGRER